MCALFGMLLLRRRIAQQLQLTAAVPRQRRQLPQAHQRRKDLRRLYEILRLQLSDPEFQIRPPWIQVLLLSVGSLQWKEEELVSAIFWIRCSFPCKRLTKSCCSMKIFK